MTLDELLASDAALPSIPRVIALLLNELGREESDQVRVLATAAAVAGAFKHIPGVEMIAFWRYSLNVAKLSRVLAGMVHQNQASAFTAGLIHATGELVMHLAMPEDMAALNTQVHPLGLKRAAVEHKHFGYCYAHVSAGFASNWQFPVTIVDALEHQYAPFENGVYEPLAGVLHLAAWRARANELNLGESDLTVNFPDVVALALGIDIDMALQQDPIEWTSKAEVSSLV